MTATGFWIVRHEGKLAILVEDSPSRHWRKMRVRLVDGTVIDVYDSSRVQRTPFCLSTLDEAIAMLERLVAQDTDNWVEAFNEAFKEK